LEIHAPEKPILTIKEAAVHLLIVTAGILIALSLEGTVEYMHHRTVVREAREIMKSEIEANQKDLNVTMDRIALQKDGLVKGIQIFSAMAKGDKPKIEGLRWMLNYRTAELHFAGHSTAELMGAFAYMDYKEVNRYAAIYDAQERFLQAQSAALADGITAFAWAEQRDIPAAAPTELAVFVERLRQTLAAMTLTGQFGGSLQKDYAKFLADAWTPRPNAIDGDWTGSLQGKPLVVHVRTFEEGLTAEIDSPKDGSFGMAASSVVLEGSQLTIQSNANSASFVGTVDADGSTIAGAWTQGGIDQPLTLTRQKGAAPQPH
jgi:hypothetical protein